MNRRSFLTTLAAAVPALVLDPERLLWVPGRKTIFLPPVRTPTVIAIDWAQRGDVFTIAGVYATNPISGETLPFLQDFVVISDVNANGALVRPLNIWPQISPNLGGRVARRVGVDGAVQFRRYGR